MPILPWRGVGKSRREASFSGKSAGPTVSRETVRVQSRRVAASVPAERTRAKRPPSIRVVVLIESVLWVCEDAQEFLVVIGSALVLRA